MPKADELEIRDLVERWVLWRDAGDWERFRTVWAPDGWMTATWFQGPAEAFIEASRRGFESGADILHFLGGHFSDVAGDRAIGQTKMEIRQRAEVHGIRADVTCTGRFYDFLRREPDGWRIVRRQPIYERDIMIPVDPAVRLSLDTSLLDRFPAGYRHLAYLQTVNGSTVRSGLPGLTGPEVDLLYAEGSSWLAGSPHPGIPI